jgi:gliding motility-associated-like protein
MKRRLVLIIFLFITFNVKSQHILSGNLVPNSGFEEFTTCPYDGSLIYLAFPWTNANSGSSDYLNNCSTSNYISNILQNNQPHNGNGCAGVFLFLAPSINGNYNYREYIEIKLTSTLINKRKYCINYFTILSKECGIAIENIDLVLSCNYITPNPVILPYSYVIDSTPQIKNSKGIISDRVNWTKISGIYISIENEKFLTIGNFNNDNSTNMLIDTTKINWKSSLYLIDDVSVCECSFDINLGADTALCESETLILNPNLPNATYTWQDSSHAATFEVKQPGTYWVRAYVAEYDVYSSDTIVITQGDENFCNPPLTIPNVITPNGDGANDNFVIQNAESYNITLQIYNRWGRMIYENTNYQNDFSCKTCAAGVYYYVIKAKSKRNGREKEYKGSLMIFNGK